MKKIIQSLCYVAVLLLFSCNKNFLDEPQPAGSVTEDAVYATETGVRSFFNGIYRNLRTQWSSPSDVYGIVSVNLAREVKGFDVSMPNGDTYVNDYVHNFRLATFRRSSFTWNFFYSFINSANTLIGGVKKSTTLSATAKTQFEAEARAFRAWCYFELAREFARSYRENPDGPGLPIYTEPTTASTEGNPRSKLSEVYKQITDDLQFAVTNIPVTRANGGLKDIINVDVVKGLQARVFLEMGMADATYLNKAITAAQEARANYPLNAAELAGTITSDFATKKEVLWGFPQAADQTIYYGTPSTFYGVSGIGPFNFFVDSNFVKLFSDTDIRKTKFVVPGSNTGLTKWKTIKFGNTTNFSDFIVMMRSPELWLIEAEAKARLNDPTAGDALFAVQQNRDPNAVKSGNTGAALIAEILKEKRKELFGEIGIGFLDIKRAGLPLKRSDGHPLNGIITIAADAPAFTLQIPQTEFDANKSLKPADQNE
ncbi:RagB/SusD family nutrient uptake outer membrane protein [Pseudoflavitalea sp. G-6-1-2]|uniref:RagB/SusD family nutrient uptake outer membrane protein n=1 Tax=Pseudoflavitalea sp. G-6-1-2 TaxID=2728841 RepID=UPI00146DF3D9|nr:RagB/SusD family nutrient uptake outer membrane protein [Pseudoflavitalea sp. G-6-1-2]NML22484.1 RagB/SusD family nutrient uptake outer membrane protein [Pseudoflavitalea sp. G-6-1-2]